MRFGIVIVSIAVWGSFCYAQPAAAPPATAASTAPARYAVVMPAGFEKVEVGGHMAICKPADMEWVKKGLAEVKPATRPTTMPVDVLKKATAGRDTVAKQMI